MRSRPTMHVAFVVALSLMSGVSAESLTATPLVTSPAYPSPQTCPPGGKYIADGFAPKPSFPQQTRAPRQPTSGGFKVETVISNISYGRSMAFMPDGRMLLAERGGNLRIAERGGTLGASIQGMPPITEPSALIGLMDVALDPDFSRNRILYLSYVTPLAGSPGVPGTVGHPPDGVGHIARARLSAADDRLDGLVELFHGSRVRRLLALRDGSVLFTTIAGDAKAQALDQDGGKVLRIWANGSAPADNPFADRHDVGRLAYDLGHRDADGFALDAKNHIWAVEHGPRGGDELNLIRRGKNYGFPVITYGREYSGAEINGGLTAQRGMEQPVYYWTPDIAPSGLMIYSGKMFPQWRGNIFVGALVAESLIRLILHSGKVVGEEFMLADRCARIRDVREAPDGSIYVLTDAAAGEVFRLSTG